MNTINMNMTDAGYRAQHGISISSLDKPHRWA